MARVTADDIPVSVTNLCASAPWIAPNSPKRAATVLAYFWPAIEKHIRQQIAGDIEQLLIPATNDAAKLRNGGIEHAARIAREGAAQ